MISLASHINSLNFSTQLDVIKDLMDSAHATTTFWGNRVVEVNGFTGSVYLDDIAEKTLMASRKRCDADDLTSSERISGVEIVKKLQKFYHDTDTEIQKANAITKFFNWIQEFSLGSPSEWSIRYHIIDRDIERDNHLIETAERNFRAYSVDKFLQQFDVSSYKRHPEEKNYYMRHPAYEGFMGPPPLFQMYMSHSAKREKDFWKRIFVNEDHIRRLLVRV